MSGAVLAAVSDDTETRSDGANSAAIDAAVVERVAADRGGSAEDLAGALVVVGADLTDAHHEYEHEYDHATVDGRRIYAATAEEWREIADQNDLDDLADAVRAAHREQAEVLTDDLPGDPVVVGVDTAEEIDDMPQSFEG